MIAEELLEKVSERLVERVRNTNLFVIKKIARKIKQIGTINPSSANDILQVMDYGGDLEEIIKEIAKETKLNIKDIYKIFDEVAKENLYFSKKYYEYRNIRFIPWEENEILRNEVKALADITANTYANISDTRGIGYSISELVYNAEKGVYEEKTTFKTISDIYKKIVDEGIISISEGKTTFNDEMGKLMKQIGKSGLKYLEYESGHHRRIDSALRMNIGDGLRNLSNQLQQEFGEKFGADGVEISVHSHPAPDHELVQGRQFRKEEFDKFQNDEDCVSYDGIKFPAVSKETKRDRRSISEYNCYHKIFSIIIGVSRPTYSNEQLQDIINDNRKGFEFEGKKYTTYQGTQLQRRLEAEIRKNKDIQIMARESGLKDLAIESQENIDTLTRKYYELSRVSGLPTLIDRLQVDGYKEIKNTK